MPPRRIIDTGSSLGQNSSAVVDGNHLYLAGHCGFLPRTPNIAGGGLEAEFRQTLKNLEATILQAGFRLDVVGIPIQR